MSQLKKASPCCLLPAVESQPIRRKAPPQGQGLHYDSTTEDEEDEVQSPPIPRKKKPAPASAAKPAPVTASSDPEETQDPSSQATRHSSDDGTSPATNKIRLTESVIEDLAT